MRVFPNDYNEKYFSGRFVRLKSSPRKLPCPRYDELSESWQMLFAHGTGTSAGDANAHILTTQRTDYSERIPIVRANKMNNLLRRFNPKTHSDASQKNSDIHRK